MSERNFVRFILYYWVHRLYISIVSVILNVALHLNIHSFTEEHKRKNEYTKPGCTIFITTTTYLIYLYTT